MATPIRETAFEHEGQRYRIREQGGELTLQAKGRSSEWESLASGRAKGGTVFWRDLEDEALQGAAVAALRSIGVLPAEAAAAPPRAPKKKRGHIHCSRCGKPDHTVRNCPMKEEPCPTPARTRTRSSAAASGSSGPTAPTSLSTATDAASRSAAAPAATSSASARSAAPGPFVVRPDGSVECPTLEDALALMKRLREENRG